MKKFVALFILLALGLFMGEAYALNAAAMQGGNPDNWYIEVEYNPGTSTVVAVHGDVMEWDVDSDTGETLGYTVHLVDADDAEIVAGVVPAWDDTAHNLRTALTDGDVFLMQIRGYHSAISTDGTVTEGQSLQSDAGYTGVQDGDGFGFAFKDDASDTNGYTSGEYFAPVWIDFDKGTN